MHVVIEYRESELPSPGSEVVGKIMNALREITHTEVDKGKTPLSLDIQNDSVDLKIKFKEKNGKEKITIKFPG